MAQLSNWASSGQAVRFLTRRRGVQLLQRHPLGRSCYPLAMGHYPQAAMHTMRRDHHEDHLLILCTDGRGRFKTDRHQARLQAGEALILPKGIAHEYAADTEAPWSILWMHFAGDAAEAAVAMLGDPSDAIHFQYANPGIVIEDFRRLLALRHEPLILPALLQGASLCQQILTTLALDVSKPRNQSRNRKQELDIHAVEHMMRERWNTRLSLQEMAEAARLSKFHFASKFKRVTGQTPVQRFTQIKMQKACELLDQDEQSVNAIAEQLGYEDPQYFSRVFKKTIGYSPRAYRSLRRA